MCKNRVSNSARTRARTIAKQVGINVFIKAQDGKCPICNNRITVNEATIDHVTPIELLFKQNPGGDVNNGNIFVVHYACNNLKSNRLPTEDELHALDIVNYLLKYDPATKMYGIMAAAFHKVRNRIISLEARRNKLDLRLLDSRLTFVMYTVEIEALEKLNREYRELMND